MNTCFDSAFIASYKETQLFVFTRYQTGFKGNCLSPGVTLHFTHKVATCLGFAHHSDSELVGIVFLNFRASVQAVCVEL